MKLPQDGTSRIGKWLLILAMVGAMAYYAFQWRKPIDTVTSTPSITVPNLAQATLPTQHTAALPYPGGPDGYIGSDACQSCHDEQHASWHRSYHRTMTQALTPESVQADFDGVTLESNGERFHLTQTNGTYWVSISDIPAERVPNAPVPNPVHLRLAMATGSHHMQVFWLPGILGNMQIGFPFTWLIEDQRWVPRPDTFIRNPDAEPVVEVWNQVCIRCHTTGGIPKPNPAERIFESEAAELGISCEACHGPGQEHVALRTREHETGQTLAQETDPIIQPADLDPHRSTQVCGACHSMKWFDKNEGWEAHGFRFRPGDELNETTPVIRASNTEDQPWLTSVLERNPGLLESFFWSDGMIRVSGREYNGLIESACHTEGTMSCVSCHSLHNSDPNDQLARNRSDNQACTQCHSAIAHDLTSHTHHPVESAGSQCYNCHMPHTTYGILKAIRSHEIDHPTVAAEKETGRPNACNLCHVDQTLEWTATYLEAWYGQTPPELDDSDRSVPAIAKSLLAGDAGQRALAAWTLGWPPAQQASGRSWQAQMLARSLDDPYSAVRYIAHRSLLQFPGFENFAYDFVSPHHERNEAVKRAVTRWQTQEKTENTSRPDIDFFDNAGQAAPLMMDALWSEQDQTPVRLRE